MAACFYLIRHARAEGSAPGGDQQRRLTPAGREAFRELVARLAGRLQVTRIHASPVLRARQTAELLAGLTGAPLQELEALSSGASSGRQLLRLGRALGAGAALIGHNPEVAQAIALAAGQDEEVPPGTVAAVDLEERLAWVVRPGASRR
jgi:phosphohistidine phosphatase